MSKKVLDNKISNRKDRMRTMASSVAALTSDTAIVNFRTKKSVKERAARLFEKMGLDMSSALNMFLSKVLETKAIPFRVTTVNGYSPEYERYILDEIKNHKDYKKFKTIEEMMIDLKG